MTNLARALIFGAISGLIWTVAIILLASESGPREGLIGGLIAGILTGMLVSLSLYRLLPKCGRVVTVIIGLFSLPLGAFIFGFLAKVADMMSEASPVGSPLYRPLASGAVCAVFSLIAFYFYPFAILTTFLLRAVVLRAQRLPRSPEGN